MQQLVKYFYVNYYLYMIELNYKDYQLTKTNHHYIQNQNINTIPLDLYTY